MTVVFLHPDLGLGGAERLVVDAASHLVANGHQVVVLTAHHDRARAFPATVDGSLDVRVRGGALPAQVLGHLRAPCAIARMAWLALGLRGLRPQPDVVVCDLVAHAIPLARLAGRAPVVLYCHHPDRFLAPAGRGLYRWYRAPIDRLEAFGTAYAARVLVNSRYTAARVREAFPTLATEPDVIHPGVDVVPCADLASDATGPATILAMGRFDPRKNLALAVEALAALRARLSPEAFAPVRLVVAGGYDRHRRRARTASGRARAGRAGVGGALAERERTSGAARGRPVRRAHAGRRAFRLRPGRGDGGGASGRSCAQRRSGRDGGRRRDRISVPADARGVRRGARAPRD